MSNPSETRPPTGSSKSDLNTEEKKMGIKLGVPETPDLSQLQPRLTVIGVGGAGCNAVNTMISQGLEGVDFIVANTDAQSLAMAKTDRRIQLGLKTTEGLGAGARPEIGRIAADEALEQLARELKGSHMAFITAGMGGGTGTGAAPVVASAAREMGILTVGVVTKPFQFEGLHRMRVAEKGIEELAEWVDTLIIIPNQNLFRIANEKTTFADAFRLADDVLFQGVRGVTDLMVNPGMINLDFADIRTVMAEMGKAMMGSGEAEGDARALTAAESAINNPLLDDASMKGARGVLINITGGLDMTLYEVDEAANRIRDEVESEANIIFGSTLDQTMEGKMRVSVVATGIDREAIRRQTDEPGLMDLIGKRELPRAPKQAVPAAAEVPAAPVRAERTSIAVPRAPEPRIQEPRAVEPRIATPHMEDLRMDAPEPAPAPRPVIAEPPPAPAPAPESKADSRRGPSAEMVRRVYGGPESKLSSLAKTAFRKPEPQPLPFTEDDRDDGPLVEEVFDEAPARPRAEPALAADDFGPEELDLRPIEPDDDRTPPPAPKRPERSDKSKAIRDDAFIPDAPVEPMDFSLGGNRGDGGGSRAEFRPRETRLDIPPAPPRAPRAVSGQPQAARSPESHTRIEEITDPEPPKRKLTLLERVGLKRGTLAADGDAMPGSLHDDRSIKEILEERELNFGASLKSESEHDGLMDHSEDMEIPAFLRRQAN